MIESVDFGEFEIDCFGLVRILDGGDVIWFWVGESV